MGVRKQGVGHAIMLDISVGTVHKSLARNAIIVGKLGILVGRAQISEEGETNRG